MVGAAGKLNAFLGGFVVVATVATAPASGGAVSAGERFEITGACRDGLANGAYELRLTDGRLRVVGAFAQGRKTGTFIFWTAGGARTAVVPYEDDRRNGTVARWYTNGSSEVGRRLEIPFIEERRHGIERSWHPNGHERGEARYEHGTLISARAWDRGGVPLSEAQAWRQAAEDEAVDERFAASLAELVGKHLPHCD